MYVTNTLRTMNDCYIEQFLDDGHDNLLRVLTERYRTYEEVV